MGLIGARALAVDEDLAALEGTARAIFGAGERRVGWLARKIAREAVVPGLSVIAFEAARPAVAIGYALVGQPVSLPGVARTAGVGVLPQWRGRGVGRLILQEVRRRAAAAGLELLEVLAEGASRGFFEGLGLEARARLWTLSAEGLGLRRGGRGRALEWEQAGLVPFSGWLAEAWAGTPEGARWSLRIAGGEGTGARAMAHVSAEGRAWLVQRLLVAAEAPEVAAVAAAAAAVRERAPRGTPTLIYGCPAGSAATAGLLARAWSRAQEGFVMRASLG